MGKTAAQRQAAYRQRHLKDVEGEKERINLVMDMHARLACKRLAKHYGSTQVALLEP